MILNKYLKYAGLLSLSMVLWQCEPAIDEFSPSKGDLDLTSFVAVGDSYSAGYTDGALGYRGQMYSFPNIMAQQFKMAGMTADFKQPLLPEDKSIGTTVIDALGHLNGYFKLMVVNGSLAPVPTLGNSELLADGGTWINGSAPFNNVAVPGARSFHLLTPVFGNPTMGVGNFNPFYARFASNPGTSTVLSDAMLKQPTFFSLWIGGNDVLGYALEGGEKDEITAPAAFEGYLEVIIQTLKQTASKGVIANVPDINALPYFNVVAYNALLLDTVKSLALNGAYAQYNQLAISLGKPTIYFEPGNNAFVIEDTNYDFSIKIRQIKSTEKILLSLPQDSIKLKGWGSIKPIPEKYVLDDAEIKLIKDATTAYNTSIRAIATKDTLAFVDLYSFMNSLRLGKTIDGTVYTTTFVSGNVFSLDGIHVTERGSAIIANEFLKAINATYKAEVPLVNINEYNTVVFP